MIQEGCAYYNPEFNILRNCENLEAIRTARCSEEILKILNTKVNILEINSYDSIDASNLIQILEKSGSSLQRLKLNTEFYIDFYSEIYSQSSLIETLMAFCPNITYLYISGVKLFTQFLNLIECLQKLQFLTICWDDGSEVKTREMRKKETKSNVKQLAEKLPSTLQYLDLTKIWLDSHIDILLDHCDAPLKQLSFRMHYDEEEKINALIRFCIRKKTLNTVSIFKEMSLDKLKDKLKKDLEGFVKLVPYESFIVNC